MQTGDACGTLVTVRPGGLIVCPECERRKRETPSWRVNRSLLKIEPETEAHALTVYCRNCRSEIKLNIARGLSVERLSH